MPNRSTAEGRGRTRHVAHMVVAGATKVVVQQARTYSRPTKKRVSPFLLACWTRVSGRLRIKVHACCTQTSRGPHGPLSPARDDHVSPRRGFERRATLGNWSARVRARRAYLRHDRHGRRICDVCGEEISGFVAGPCHTYAVVARRRPRRRAPARLPWKGRESTSLRHSAASGARPGDE